MTIVNKSSAAGLCQGIAMSFFFSSGPTLFDLTVDGSGLSPYKEDRFIPRRLQWQ
jgi:hypothetical protein